MPCICHAYAGALYVCTHAYERLTANYIGWPCTGRDGSQGRGGRCEGGEGSAYALPTLVPAAAPPQPSNAKCTCVVGSRCRCTRTRLIRVLVQTDRRAAVHACVRGACVCTCSCQKEGR